MVGLLVTYRNNTLLDFTIGRSGNKAPCSFSGYLVAVLGA